MLPIFFIVRTEGLDQLLIGKQPQLLCNRQGRLEGTRVGVGHFDVHMTDIDSAKALYEDQRFRMRMPLYVKPAAVGQSAGCHDERVLVPATDRIPHPGWERVLR